MRSLCIHRPLRAAIVTGIGLLCGTMLASTATFATPGEEMNGWYGDGGKGAASAIAQSIARQWNEQLINAIRIDSPRPPVHARNLYHVSAAMWDAWAAYDSTADQVIHKEKVNPLPADVLAARNEAISFAAYRVIRTRYIVSANAATTFAALDAKMDSLGYDKSFTSTAGNTPAALGNRIAADVLAYGLGDNANEQANYAPNNGYAPSNVPLIVGISGTSMLAPNQWQPLALDYAVTQNGIVIGAVIQKFVCPHWEGVKPFCLTAADSDGFATYFNPPPPPFLGGVGDSKFKANAVELVQMSHDLDPTIGSTKDIGPGANHNNTCGYNDGTGYPVNPYTGQPYAPNVVPYGDYARVLAEFWADGPQSETPPGHWNVLANYVSDSPLIEKRIGGQGPIVDNLEWDVKLYLALNGAEHDAAVACWGCKGVYDYVRPISLIRYMGGLGQSSDPLLPSYNPNGLPLAPGLIELITAQNTAPGMPMFKLVDFIGEIAIDAWKGQPNNPATQIGGTGWIRSKDWKPYQKNTFVTPPFGAYTSGHSTYSRSGAEVLSLFTGSTYFPGGLGTYTAPQNGYLTFEIGPSQTVQLQWARYYDAADEAGISRRFGGIHVEDDDRIGRQMGQVIGPKSYARAVQYYNGTSCQADIVGNDHVVDVSDLMRIINDWGPCVGGHSCHSDVVVNGAVDINDLFLIINNWGNCQ